MPTRDQVLENQLLRSQFLAALYDAEAMQQHQLGLSLVTDVLTAIGKGDHPDASVALLVKSLEQAGMIEGMGESIGDIYAPEVRLTDYGRREVESWVTSGDQTTAQLPLSYNTVYHTTIHGPQGSVVNVGSTNTTITLNNQFGQKLNDVVAAARNLLEQDKDLSVDDREDLTEDIATLEQEAKAEKPNQGRVKSALRRVGKWAGAAVVTAGSQEVQHLTAQALQAITS